MIAVIGLGEDGLAGLSPAARAVVEQAEVLVGGARHLGLVGPHPAEKLGWRTPLSATMADIEARRDKRVVVLATGDPMWFGVGVALRRHFPPGELLVLPSPSAFSLACARLAWPLAEVECLTLHGRPIETLNGWLAPGLKLLLLSHDGTTPAKVAARLREAGFGPSRMVVLERMGGPAEKIVEATAESWRAEAADFNAIALELVAGPAARPLSRAPGLPDDVFRHDGQVTKREVRALTLARLAPMPGHVLWDVGAGCGSISIEWTRAARFARATAVEREASRAALIAENALALGAPTLQVVRGTAPEALAGLPQPDAVFVGGGLSSEGLVEACWRALKPGGRLVANAVTVEGEAALAAAQARRGGDLTRLAASRAEPVGSYLGWRPLMPVTQWAATK
jgi:precorrin-6Y C5,15-methyltransferase (decarboxylating)